MKRELTSQELLDRYVHSVKTMLPPDKMNDIAAEIRSNLQSLVEDRAAQLGRELRPRGSERHSEAVRSSACWWPADTAIDPGAV